jgi:group I intron endonuclease
MKSDYKEVGNASKNGIYRITNKENGRVYYGSCKSFKRRFLGHRNSLEAGKHQNRFLQADFNKCGAESFLFEVVEIVDGDRHVRLDIEQNYLDKFYDDGKNCYNLRKSTHDTREGSGNTKPSDPLTDKRCQPPAEEIRIKRQDACKAAYTPEIKADMSAKLKQRHLDNSTLDLTFTHKDTREVVALKGGTIKDFCISRDLNYKAFHQMVSGKSKFSAGWFLGKEEPAIISQKGQVRKSLSPEHREKIAGGKFAGVVLTHDNGTTLTVEYNVKEQCRKLELNYKSFLRLLNGSTSFYGDYRVTPENLSFLKAPSVPELTLP